MKRFSKLKKEIENLFHPDLKMEFCCSAYWMRPKNGYASRSIPRFYVKLDGKIIWDYPKDFEVDGRSSEWCSDNGISALVREYIDTPIDELLHKKFSGEYKRFGDIITYRKDPKGEKVKFIMEQADPKVATSLIDIFKMADRRLGKKKIAELGALIANYSPNLIIAVRLYGWEGLAEPWRSR